MTQQASQPFSSDRSFGDLEQALADTLTGLQRDRAAARLWQYDAKLWGADSDHARVIGSRLGWLRVLDAMEPQVPGLLALRDELHAEGFRQVLLLGMGGSSLCPEVLRNIFGVAPGGLDVVVLDNTSPESVRAAEAQVDLRHAAILVSGKSGGTVETSSFQEYFEARLAALGVTRPGDHLLAITDPGTQLHRLAESRGYRKVFLNPPDIGGRYSALSLFGLVPAALLGIDMEAYLGYARAMARACGPEHPGATNPGLMLGAALGMAARHGYDKVTLLPSPSLAPLGSWLEQLVAESTGKEGRGVVPVDGEPPAEPAGYGPDRIFVAFSLEGEHQETERRADALAAAGHPVLRWRLKERAQLAAEFYRWEVATAILGSLLQVDPFDEPNVTESKNTTRDLLAARASGAAAPGLAELAAADGLRVQVGPKYASQLQAALAGAGHDPARPESWLAAHLSSVRESDYLALCAYLHRTPARHAALDGLRARLGPGHATTLGYGPRFLHSTGQLHKGGPNHGLFLQLTVEDGADVDIPGARYGFRALRDAQALGDILVLDRRGRRALRVHLDAGADAGLAALDAALARAMKLAGPLPMARRTEAR